MTLYELDQVIKDIEQDIEDQKLYKVIEYHILISIDHTLLSYIEANRVLGIDRITSLEEMIRLVEFDNPIFKERDNAIALWDKKIARLRADLLTEEKKHS